MKYLSTRYAKGKETVEAYMSNNHRYVSLELSVLEAQADLLSWQADLRNTNAYLASMASNIEIFLTTNLVLPPCNGSGGIFTDIEQTGF